MPAQKQGSALITRVDFHTSTKVLATLFGACPNFFSEFPILQYCTGTPLYQKHAVHLKMSTRLQCPLCQQADSALYFLSGCRHKIISGMIIERHNVACRLIMKAISKASLAGRFVQLDAGSTDRLAQQNLQFLSILITGHYPAGFLMLVNVLETESPVVAPMLFWSPH